MKTTYEKTGRYTQKESIYYTDGDLYDTKEKVRPLAIVRDVLFVFVLLLTLVSSAFIIGEGERGVVTRFGEATHLVEPGLNFKVPFVDGIKRIEVRERRTVEDLAAATKNQLPITATVSLNWTVNSEAVMEVYKDYGSLTQFQERILDPKLREAAKAAIAKSNADELIRDRQAATAEIMALSTALLEGYPVTVNSPQIENVALPQTYLDAVLAKEKAREDAAREQYNLDRQALEAQQKVQTAEAERDAAKAQADGNAYRTRTEAEAEAEAIRLKKNAEADGIREVEEALSANPLFVDYTRALQWDGQLPQTVLGDGQNLLMNIK